MADPFAVVAFIVPPALAGMIEKDSDTQRKNKIAVQGVLDGTHCDGTGTQIGTHEEEPSQKTQEQSNRIAEHPVYQRKEQGIKQDEKPPVRDKVLKPIGEKGPEDDLLRQGGEQGIEEHDRQPESGTLYGKHKKQFGENGPDRNAQQYSQQDEAD